MTRSLSEIKDIVKDLNPEKRSKLQDVALRQAIATNLRDIAQRTRDALLIFNVRVHTLEEHLSEFGSARLLAALIKGSKSTISDATCRK